MDEAAIIKEFKQAGAIQKGHFILSSGLHSDTYVQCAKIFTKPILAEKLCYNLAKKITNKFGHKAFDLIVSPAVGGIIVGYEMARQLELEAVFCERVNGKFTLRRDFSIKENARILVVEDVLTTGKSSIETFECIKSHRGQVIAEACLIDRSENINLGVPLISLLKLDIETFTEDMVPVHLKNISPYKPGSRYLT